MKEELNLPELKIENEIDLEFNGSPEQVEGELTALYNSLNIQYPKFYKMNLLCKLGFIGVEQLLNGQEWLSGKPNEKIATLFINRSSSISSDSLHAAAIAVTGQLASPAVFVYTLPNILNGELAIRHGWTGYNAFFIEKEYDTYRLEELIRLALISQTSDAFIAGWVETDLAGQSCSCKLRLYSINY